MINKMAYKCNCKCHDCPKLIVSTGYKEIVFTLYSETDVMDIVLSNKEAKKLAIDLLSLTSEKPKDMYFGK